MATPVAKRARKRRNGTVSRAGLVQAARSSGCRFVAITAPAGYGKSTFLDEWAAAEDRRVVRVALDRFDDDPATLLASLGSANRRAGLTEDRAVARGDDSPRARGAAVRRLADEVGRSPVSFVLMVDGLEQLGSPECDDVLDALIAAIPAGSQLVLASRSEPRQLPRLRASGEAMEFGAGELALDAAGARQIFADARVTLTPGQAAAVTERTEGWPAGLRLAALGARKRNDPTPTIAGDDREVGDYLCQETLLGLPADLQRFLRRTAVLDELSGPVCDATLGSGGGAGSLRRLEAAGAFLVPLDRRRTRYRYHPLFREFLIKELDRADPGLAATLHRRAGDWYEAHGSPERAIEHLLQTGDPGRPARVVSASALPTAHAGGTSTVQRWLRTLGDHTVEHYPPLAVAAGWVGVLTGDAPQALRWASVADAAHFDGAPPDGSASFDSSRAMLRAALCADGPEQMLADANVAVAAEPVWSPWRPVALWLLGEAYELAGRPDAARGAFADGSMHGSVASASDAVIPCEARLALLAMDRDDWQEGADRLAHALARIDEQPARSGVTWLLTVAGAARLCVHRGDLEQTRRHLAHAMRARSRAGSALPFVAIRLRLQLARAFLAIADHESARRLLREADDILSRRPMLGTLVEEVSEFRRVLAAGGGATGRPPLTSAEMRLLPYLQTHLTGDRIAERLSVSTWTVKTQVKSIYRKLGVSSRDAAVQKAAALGLLGADVQHRLSHWAVHPLPSSG